MHQTRSNRPKCRRSSHRRPAIILSRQRLSLHSNQLARHAARLFHLHLQCPWSARPRGQHVTVEYGHTQSACSVPPAAVWLRQPPHCLPSSQQKLSGTPIAITQSSPLVAGKPTAPFPFMTRLWTEPFALTPPSHSNFQAAPLLTICRQMVVPGRPATLTLGLGHSALSSPAVTMITIPSASIATVPRDPSSRSLQRSLL